MHLFIDPVRVVNSSTVREWLGVTSETRICLRGEKNGVLVEIRPEDRAAEELMLLSLRADVRRVYLSLKGSAWLANAVPHHKRHITFPFDNIMAIQRDDNEVIGIKRACVNDGVAFAVLCEWLERQLNSQNNLVVTEFEVVEKLEEIKRTLFQIEYVTHSFPTMSVAVRTRQFVTIGHVVRSTVAN